MKSISTILTIIILMIINLIVIIAISEDNNKSARSNNKNYNIVTLGAKPNSKFDSSKALNAAWNMACGSSSGSTIFVPKGQFLVTKALKFSGIRCKSKGITFVIKGTIVAPKNFQVIGNSKSWMSFEDVDGVTISGGVFDGQGARLWSCKKHGNDGCPRGATTLRFTNSKNVVVDGVTSINSQLYHIVFDGCKKVKVEGVKVSASGDSPNTDGIHVQQSSGVTILNSHIATGDDCISIGDGTTNLWIQDIACGPGHGISIGSLGKELQEAGVENVTVKTATFTNTENGVRIKSWGRPSSGFVKNVVFQHITMVNAHNPIIIDQKYCPHKNGCPGQVSGVKVNGVTYKDIHGSSATEIAVKFDCSSKYHCGGLKLEDINLTYNKGPSSSFCTNSGGSNYGVIQPKSCL